MPNTITAFYTFTAATKARSSQVNTNFSNYRGDLLPINEDTITASDSIHNLGSTDHRWKSAFLTNLQLTSSTTTAGLTLTGDTAATAGAWSFKIAGSEVGRFSPRGLETNYKAYYGGFTTTAAPTGSAILVGATTVNVQCNSPTEVTMCSSRINTYGGRLLELSLVNSSVDLDYTTVGLGINRVLYAKIYRGATTTALSVIKTVPFGCTQITASTTVTYSAYNVDYKLIDSGYTPGEVVYQVTFFGDSTFNTQTRAYINLNLLLREI